MDSFEVLVKIDSNHREMVDFLEAEVKTRPFSLRYIATPKLDGYWSMHTALSDLLKKCSPETYFVWVTNDEIRFASHGWDTCLLRHKGLFPDHAFYLRTSDNKNRLCSLVECCPRGEHLGFFSKKWLELVEGFDRGCSDTGNELINFHLRTALGRERSIAIDGIDYLNIEETVSADHGLSEKQWKEKLSRIWQLYSKLLKYDTQKNMLRRAQRVNAHIWAYEHEYPRFQLFDDHAKQAIVVVPEGNNGTRQQFSYQLPMTVWLQNIQDSIKANPSEFTVFLPVMANLKYMQRIIAERLISGPFDATGPWSKAELRISADMLINMAALYGGFSFNNVRMDDEFRYSIRSLVEYLSDSHYQSPEEYFIRDMKLAFQNGLSEDLARDYLLALRLYEVQPVAEK
jgi:hypothetical protein